MVDKVYKWDELGNVDITSLYLYGVLESDLSNGALIRSAHVGCADDRKRIVCRE
jgi:hypothetical protein